MSVLYFLLGIVLLGLLILLVVGPIREGVVDDTWEENPDDLPPERRREVALEELRQARFEYEAEKLPEEDYRRIRTRWGRMLLQAEEELGMEEARPGPGAAAEAGRPGVSEAPAEAGTPEGAGEPASEAGGASPGTVSGDDVPPGREPCPECGALPRPGARFCSHCGSRLPEEPAAEEGSGQKDASGPDAGGGTGPEAGGSP